MTRPNSNPAASAASLAGAVDLSGLANKAATGSSGAAGPAAGSPAGGALPAGVQPVDESNIREVLEAPGTAPTFLVIWMPGDPGSEGLLNRMSRLRAEQGQAWGLASLDASANQQLAAGFRVQAVPTTIAIIGGRMMPLFEGDPGEEQIKQAITAAYQAAGTQAPEGAEPTAPPEDPRITSAQDKAAAGDLAGAVADLDAVLSDAPADADAQAMLAQVKLLQRTEGTDPNAAVAAADAAPDDVALGCAAADAQMLLGEAEAAYQRLVDLVSRSAGDEREQARTWLLDLFSMAAAEDPAVKTARRKLARALY